MMSGCPALLVSATGWIKGVLGMLDRDDAETGSGSWGRDSELDEEPTLLHDSEPEKSNKMTIISFLHFPRTTLTQTPRGEEPSGKS